MGDGSWKMENVKVGRLKVGRLEGWKVYNA